jgi:hypothetical protein
MARRPSKIQLEILAKGILVISEHDNDIPDEELHESLLVLMVRDIISHPMVTEKFIADKVIATRKGLA